MAGCAIARRKCRIFQAAGMFLTFCRENCFADLEGLVMLFGAERIQSLHADC